MATTSPTTQPVNPPPSPPQAANSTFWISPPAEPQQQLQHHRPSPTAQATVATSTPAAPANTSPRAALCRHPKSSALAPIAPTRPAQSPANNTTPPPSTASPPTCLAPTSPTLTPTPIQIPTAMFLRSPLPAALLPRHLLLLRLDLHRPVAVLATALASPDLETGSSLTVEVTFADMRMEVVRMRARMRGRRLGLERPDDKVWSCVAEIPLASTSDDH